MCVHMAIPTQLIALNIYNPKHNNTDVCIQKGLAKSYTEKFGNTHQSVNSILMTIWFTHTFYVLQ